MLLPDGFAVHVAFVAAERAGLTVVGIGHRAGAAELRHLLTKTGATAIVTLEHDESRLPDDLTLTRVIVSPDGESEAQRVGLRRPMRSPPGRSAPTTSSSSTPRRARPACRSA